MKLQASNEVVRAITVAAGLALGLVAGMPAVEATTARECRNAEMPLPAARVPELLKVIADVGAPIGFNPGERETFAGLKIEIAGRWLGITFPDEAADNIHMALAPAGGTGLLVFTHRSDDTFYAYKTDDKLTLVAAVQYDRGGEVQAIPLEQAQHGLRRVLAYWHCRKWTFESPAEGGQCRNATAALPASRVPELVDLLRARGSGLIALPESKLFSTLRIPVNDKTIDQWRSAYFRNDLYDAHDAVMLRPGRALELVFTRHAKGTLTAFHADATLKLIRAARIDRNGAATVLAPEQAQPDYASALAYWHCREWTGPSGLGNNWGRVPACKLQPFDRTKAAYLEMAGRRMRELHGITMTYPGKIVYRGQVERGFDLYNFPNDLTLSVTNPFYSVSVHTTLRQPRSLEHGLTLATISIAYLTKSPEDDVKAKVSAMMARASATRAVTSDEVTLGLSGIPVARTSFGPYEVSVLPPLLNDIRITIKRWTCN